ncbi:hypothetical protein ETB97_007683 [Aspergillus alliaceus]|uniref:Uncharacterized protein n=1 Tax=Petromyces alliaceus TaxID=209559 RepID=A0A8H6E2V6_PETAA|nr:hypothetical protein ETB97_007683 [Aspergillus burnettii]
MKEIWKNNYVEDVGNLESVLDPVLKDCVFRATVENRYKANGHELSSNPSSLSPYKLDSRAIEELPRDTLQKLKPSPSDAGEEESIIDSIKTHARRFGAVILKYGKQAIKRGIPLLLSALKNQLEAEREADPSQGFPLPIISAKLLKYKSGTNFVAFSSAARYEPIKWTNGDDIQDTNPDSPVSESESPVSPDSEEE